MGAAVELTLEVLRTRTRRFKSLVKIIVAVSLVPLITSAILADLLPSLALLLLFPLCAANFWLDARLIREWQQSILRIWMGSSLDLDVLRRAMLSIPTLPRRTLKGMLDTLPAVGSSEDERKLNRGTKEAVAATVLTITRCQADRTLWATIAFTLALASAALAVLFSTWAPLWGLLSVIPVMAFGKWLPSFRLRQLRREIRKLPQDHELDVQAYTRAVNGLDWGCIGPTRKDRFLAVLGNPG